MLDGKQRIANTIKRTYEHIADHGCNSYSLFRIPGYSIVMKGLMEGVAASLDEENREPDSVRVKAQQSSKSSWSISRKIVVEPEEATVPTIYDAINEEEDE